MSLGERLSRRLWSILGDYAIKPVPDQYLFDDSRYVSEKGVTPVSPYIQRVIIHDPVSRQALQSQKVSVNPLTEIEEDVPSTFADVGYTVPADRRKMVYQVYGDMVAVGVADRDFNLTISKAINGTALLSASVTGDIRLTDTQAGSIFMPPHSIKTYMNDNATITTEDTNITGVILEAADSLIMTWNNKNVNDRARFQVLLIDLPVV